MAKARSKLRFRFILLVTLAADASGDEAKISSLAIGVHRPGEKSMLTPAFINAVNRYLSRYEPRLIERSVEHVRMIVDYDFEYGTEAGGETGVRRAHYDGKATGEERHLKKRNSLAEALQHGL